VPFAAAAQRVAHHGSVSALWAEKWRAPCAAGTYPFGEGRLADFEPIIGELIEASGDDPGILHRPDEYAKPFLPVGRRLLNQARSAGDAAAARDLFLRAAAVYRIARFPVNRSRLSQEAWERGKAAYAQAARLLDPPLVPVEIPFVHADPSAGDLHASIPAYLRRPTGPAPAAGWPVVLLICGLDSYRTDHTLRTGRLADRGFATLTFEIPGTGDCPAAPDDPESADRLMSSVLDWVAAAAGLDTGRVIARGVSTGSYYAARAAHTHAGRLAAAVAQGGGCHYAFDATWIGALEAMEYPFAAAEALAHKFGYRDAAPVAQFASGAASRFSLLNSGVLDRPACRMLVINGMEDSIFPIEDSFLLATSGRNADLVVLGGLRHMAEPSATAIIDDWLGTTAG
jgi:pimeloyl-ACP methyl ester carboxylesterase